MEGQQNFNTDFVFRTLLWMKAGFSKYFFPISTYKSFPSWLSRNRLRIVASISAFFIFWFFDIIPHSIISFISYFRKIEVTTQVRYLDLFFALEENSIFALSIYAIFKDSIERWLGYKLKESSKLNHYDFLLKVANSKGDIKIIETFIESLITLHSNEFETALKIYVDNCKKNNAGRGSIRILLLDPYSEASEDRLKELFPHYEKDKRFSHCKNQDEFIEAFQTLMYSWLKMVSNIRRNIKTYVKDHLDFEFEVKIFNIKPPYSLYYADNYASFGYHKGQSPSTESTQLIFLDTKSEATKFQLEPFEKIWNSTTLFVSYFIKRPPRNQALIKEFKEIKKLKDVNAISKVLIEIARKCENEKHNILDLLQHLEESHKHIQSGVHYNIFGTGGDSFKTINISTIVSILSSHYSDDEIISLPIKKSGTLAVTCKVGSQNFYDALQSELLEKSKLPQNINLQYLDYNINNESLYLPIIFFGYIYYDIIREARKIIDKENCIDIYKIIFPPTNLTGYKGIVNGVSKDSYIQYYEFIYESFRKTGIIVHNRTYDTDELFLGENKIIYYRNGIKQFDEIFQISVGVHEQQEYLNFFKESDPGEHVRKFTSLFLPATLNSIKMTICCNIALLLKLHYLCADNYNIELFRLKTISKLSIKVKEKFFK